MFILLNKFIVLKRILGGVLVSLFGVIYSLGGSTDVQGVYYNKDSFVTYCFYAPTKKIGLDEFIGKTETYDIHLAKNEYEGCMIAIRSKYCSTHRKYTLEFTDFTNENGDKLETKVYEEKYVKCFSDKDYGNFPEICEEVPLNEPFEKILAYACNWPYYIEVHADENTKPGKYTAEVTVKQKDADVTEFTAELSATVWDFALSPESSCETAFGLGKYNIDKAHNLDPDSEESTEMYKKYYEFLLDRRISPYNLPYDILSPEADAYMSDPRITSFIIPCPEDDELLVKYYEKVQSNPVWAAKGCFYPIDEPGNEEAYTRYNEITERLERLCPGYHMVTPFGGLTVEMNGEKVPTPVLQKNSDIVCPISDSYEDETFRSQIEDRRADGSKIWWYVCCAPDPADNYCNFFTHYEGIRQRMLFWQQKALNINGLLYWESAYWTKIDSPWTDQHTTPWTGMNTFGDGNLLYPGTEGPVPSLRLFLISSGIEDFQMLTYAEELFGRDYVEEKISKVSKNLKNYTLDDNKLMEIRVQIGNDIEAEINK